jgi:hypothetical protein
MSLVTVYTAFSSADAQLVRSRLEAAGINAEVSDEIAALSMEGYSMAAGGIRINVPEQQVDSARELIADLSKLGTDDDSA